MRFRKLEVLMLLLIFFTNPLFAGENSTDTFVDNDTVFTLGEVVATADRFAVNLATTVTELSAADIIARGSQTVGEALGLLPGVYVQTGGKGQAFVSIRGFEQRDVKVLIDGVPAHESYYGTVDLSMIPTEAISKITVTKGASSVLYGANTMGGVINIITKKGGSDYSAEVTASFGNDGARNYIFNHGGNFGPFDYWLTFGYRASDGYRLPDDFNPADPVVGIGTDYNEDGGVRDLSSYIKRNINAKVGYTPRDTTSLYLSFDYHNNEREAPTEASRYWEFTKWDQWQLNLVGEQYVADTIKVKARLFYVKHDDTLTDVGWDDEHTTGRKWFETSSYDDYSRGAELHTFMDLGRWADLKMGFNYLRDNHEQQDFLDSESRGTPGFTANEEYTGDTYTLAVEDEMAPTDSLSIVVGVSYDIFKPVKAFDQPVPGDVSAFNPQMGFVYTLSDATSLHASVGKKTRFPKLLELYSEHAGGNPDLDPQKTISYEVGARHHFSNEVSGALSYFYNDISDLIDRERDADRNWVFYNLYEATIQGIELDIDVQVTGSFAAKFGYTYMDTEDKANEGRELEGRPVHVANLDFRYKFPFGLSTNLQATYTKGAHWEDPEDNWAELSDYLLVNLRLSYNLKSALGSDSQLFVEVKNVTDTDYYETNGPEPGRNILAGVTMRF